MRIRLQKERTIFLSSMQHSVFHLLEPMVHTRAYYRSMDITSNS
nr:MAG TPA: hypothetical protein [Caudoviricetes sp.]